MHGVVHAKLAGSSLGCAVHTNLAAGFGFTSVEVEINFTRAVTVASGRLRCGGEVARLVRPA